MVFLRAPRSITVTIQGVTTQNSSIFPSPECFHTNNQASVRPRKKGLKMTALSQDHSRTTLFSFCAFCGPDSHNAFACPRRTHARTAIAASITLHAKTDYNDPSTPFFTAHSRIWSVERMSTNPELPPEATCEHIKERRASLPDNFAPPNQSDPAGQDYQRPDESARTAQSNYYVYNSRWPTRIGRFTSDDTQPVYNDLTAWRLNQGRFSIL